MLTSQVKENAFALMGTTWILGNVKSAMVSARNALISPTVRTARQDQIISKAPANVQPVYLQIFN
jgi:hypothetical protein